MTHFSLSEETFGYLTNDDSSNTDTRYVATGSRNMLIDSQKKIQTRGGYTRLGTANTALITNRNAWTWQTSTGVERAQRCNDGVLEIYLATIDGSVINAWTTITSALSTTKKVRHAEWFDATEKIDVSIMVQGDTNMYEWNGAVAVVSSVTGTTITKGGTLTFAQSRFYTTRNMTVVCVRTGTEYTYSGGTDSLTLTGITDTTGLIAGDILVQKVVTQANKPLSSHTNDVIFSFENQIVVGSYSDNLVYISKNSDYTSMATSTPRVAGEGATLTLDSPIRAINSVGKFLTIFSGMSSLYKVEYAQITVGTTLAETVKVKRLDTGVNQGALSQEAVVPIGDSLAFISNEPALRVISNPEELLGIDPKTFSNPIKPDFDAEDWTDAFGIWVKNILIFTAPVNGRMWMLNFTEDSDGRLFRYWNPPQYLPVGPMSLINTGSGSALYGHSNAVAESYLLFDGLSDGQYADMDVNDKLPIDCRLYYAYNRAGPPVGHRLPSPHGYARDREALKNFDEFFVEGEITSNSKPNLLLNYDFDGATQQINKTIDGSDDDILEGLVGLNSLAQSSLATQPLAGLLMPPPGTRKFKVIFEVAKEDYFSVQDVYSSNEVDWYWGISARGGNVTLSPRIPINRHK